MGDQQEEAAAMDRIIQESIKREAAALAAADAARKAAEAAKAQGQNSMTADGTAVGWPDNDVRSEPGRLTQAAGKLGLGKAGDAELAKRLLNDGQPAPGSRGSASGEVGKSAAGARAKAGSFRGAKPALEH